MSVTEQIERKIDRDVAGGLAMIGAGGATNIAPRNMGELMEFAKLMSLAGVAVRKEFRGNPGMCLAISLQAFRWGMDPIAVANKSYAVNDQIAYEAQLVHAVVNERAPLQKRLRATYTGEGMSRKCKVIGLLRGEDEPFEYETPSFGSIPVKNSPLWKNDPDQQLWYFAVRSWARKHVPEVIMGVYTPDEITAQETHYGPDNAKDVTPPRPRLEQFAEQPKPPEIDIINGDGETETFADWIEALNRFEGLLTAARKVGIKAAEGIWESNEEFRKALYKDGPDGALDAMQGFFTKLTAPVETAQKPASPSKADPTPERQPPQQNGTSAQPVARGTTKEAAAQREIPGKKSASGDLLGADQRVSRETAAPARPNSPIAQSGPKGNWAAWVPWFIGELKKLGGVERSEFVGSFSRECDHMAENRPEDWDVVLGLLEQGRGS